LAQHVRRFTLRDWYDADDVQVKRKITQTRRGVDVLREAVFANSHSGKDFEKWMKRISGDHPDALLALLLPTLVRLEKFDLSLRSGYLYFDQMLTRAIAKEKPFDKQPLFPALKEFMHQPLWEWYIPAGSGKPMWQDRSISSKYIILFQSIPNIRSIFA